MGYSPGGCKELDTTGWLNISNDAHRLCCLVLRQNFFFFNFLATPVACGILVPWSGIEPSPSALEVESLNQWTTREVPMAEIYTINPGQQITVTADYLKDASAISGFLLLSAFWGFPGGSSGKESACQCRRCRFDPWVLLPEERCVQVQVLQQRVLAAACVKVSISGPPPPFLPPCHLVQVWNVKVKVRGPNRWAGGLGLLPYWVSPSAGSHLNVNPRIFTETHRIYDRGSEEGFELQILTWGWW